MPLLLLPSTTATIDNTAIGTISSIPLPPLSMTTAIVAVNNGHPHCYTVNDNNCQKPVVVVCHQPWQWLSLLTEVTVNGSQGDGGLC
jgi:hypothetical protein